MRPVSQLPALCFTVLLFTCCSVSGFQEQALVEPAQVSEAIALEQDLNQRENLPVPKNENWYKVIDGTAPVIITAPHSTRPLREGKRRFSDGGGTAALAVALGELTGAHVIYTTYEGPSDPNYYDNNLFKETLGEMIQSVKPQILIDIHGSHPYRSYDIDLGTMGSKSLLDRKELIHSLTGYLNKEGIFSISHNRFDASKNQTITKFASSRNVPAIQLEINATYVMPSAGNLEAQRFSRLLQALTHFINASKVE